MDTARRSMLMSIVGFALAPTVSTSAGELGQQSTPPLTALPPNLPRPVDDGGARHLPGTIVPSIRLRSTAGRWVTLTNIRTPRVIVYCYPMTGVPGKPLPDGWDDIPGARGCTPETCG